ncbi:lantibiotic dehydratase C-terminal domain-containing protein [Murinocardiopsis flavida]|uniref:lantibiotic dehydratase C-terminal domain-containing protein n=1 Tax=Murinocardiopsis flavida TaxID=645275 RepID=UPI0014760CB3|nr:lantibiotic dehydratase C-terminal domain-containing protein [Murinocardiopsis flavida]
MTPDPAHQDPVTPAPTNPDPVADAIVPLNADPVDTATLREGDWLAAHIYYTGERTPILQHCTGPVVRDLRERGLISDWYFLRHWLEGKHLRLRVRPTSLAALPQVQDALETAVAAFLTERPSVYEERFDIAEERYRERFLLEFSEEQWRARYGAAERMPRRENNTVEFMEYVPEARRYGGPEGVRIAEEHFVFSSDTVQELADTQNLHVRTVMLGALTQLMAVTALAFFDRPDRCAAFFDDYVRHWDSWFVGRHNDYEDAYARMSDSLRDRVRLLHGAVRDGGAHRLPGYVGAWLDHCVALRARLTGALERGELDFAVGPLGPADAEGVFATLLRSYLHLTANRLGASVDSEVYLSYVLGKALREELVTAP